MHDLEIKKLESALEQIWEIALRFGLDPFPTRFEIVPATVMYEVGSYALPGRYSHWTFGKAYHRMKMMYDFGLSKIYEVVINTNPSYGFLLETNSPIQNKLVMAHVLGHVDFFKNNVYFSRTNRRMVESVSTNAGRMMEYEFRHGRKTVEQFLDAVLSIEEHIDPNFFIKRESPLDAKGKKREKLKPREGRYDDLWKLGEKREGTDHSQDEDSGREHEQSPEKDLVYYIMRNSPSLQDWQRDVMATVHEEMEYFVPQMQTKILNEGWACLTGDALLLTDKGFIRFDELYRAGEKIHVAGGEENQAYKITDFHREEGVPTIRIRTRRGLTVEGALRHRILLPDENWAYLEDLKPGDRIAITRGTNIWPKEYRRLNYALTQQSITLNQIAALAGGVSLWTVLRHMKGRRTRNTAQIATALKFTAYRSQRAGKALSTRSMLRVPIFLNEDLAWLLGYFIGNGNRTKSGICFTCGDEDYAGEVAAKMWQVLGLRPVLYRDPTDTNWQIVVHSHELVGLLQYLGIDLRDKAPGKKVPVPVLRSPKEVMSAFLRGYFDADANAGREGIKLSSSSMELIRTVQIVLLNYGILSTVSPRQDGCGHLEITGDSAAIFFDEIGFGLARKQRALRDYVERRCLIEKEERADTVVSIECGCADVFDITVDTKHAYVANGFTNHNSFWHARIMRELDLSDTDLVEFADLHSGVVSPHKGQLNPYYLGYKILEDIERRWDNPSAEEREKFGRPGGEGRAKIFEVRELENDVSLLRNYLTEGLSEELDLFVYELVDEEEWTITEKRWERVRDQLVANMTNSGFPYIVVADGDYNHNRELYLKHLYEGAELDTNYGRKVLEHVYSLWGRPVHLETIVDDECSVMNYDGENHGEN